MLHRNPEAVMPLSRLAGLSLLLVLLASIWFAAPACSAEEPPSQNAKLQFKKTLHVTNIPGAKVFSETREVVKGDSLWKILTEGYGVDKTAVKHLLKVFKKLNPDVDPNRIFPGQRLNVPFKVERSLAKAAVEEPEISRTITHAVASGESLWRILRDSYSVPADEMSETLKRIAAANPDLEDLGRLSVGQKLNIVLASDGQRSKTSSGDNAAAFYEKLRTVEEVLVMLGCTIEHRGETFLPISRGHALRLDGANFPLVTGPTGRRVILDPKKRITNSLVKSIKSSWNYEVVSGTDAGVADYIERILSKCGFHEFSTGPREVELDTGVKLVASPLWTVIPTPEAIWDGSVHLFFSASAALDPALVRLAAQSGFSLHVLGGDAPSTEVVSAGFEIATLDMSDTAAGLAQVLGVVGIPHKVRPPIEVDLGQGVIYRIVPELTFSYSGLDYAVPPKSPLKAESVLLRSGYFTFAWPEGSSALNRLGDLFALLGTPSDRKTISVPEDAPLYVKIDGMVVEGELLAAGLGGGPSDKRVFFTEARTDDEVAGRIIAAGYLPAMVK